MFVRQEVGQAIAVCHPMPAAPFLRSQSWKSTFIRNLKSPPFPFMGPLNPGCCRPDFENCHYIAMSPEPFSPRWIEPKGRLREASREEVDALELRGVARLASPEAIGLNYQSRDQLAVYR